MRLIFLSAPFGANATPPDGAQIYDSKIFAAISKSALKVEHVRMARQRSWGLPLWQSRRTDKALLERLRAAVSDGARIVLSHEAFFKLAHEVPVAALIVHNYMPCFSFPDQRWLESYYRLGSRSFFGQAFANARAIVFLSHRDHRHAVADFPDIASRSHVLPPPPQEAKLSSRRTDLVHVSGSENWLPKRLSRLTPREAESIVSSGFAVSDFGHMPSPAFGLITDRFAVGFKLKLMQMLYIGDAIASLSDISDEMEALAPTHPFWRRVESVAEALHWFREIRDTVDSDMLDHAFALTSPNWKIPDWSHTGQKLVAIAAGASTLSADETSSTKQESPHLM